MTWRVSIRPDAMADLQAARDWYERHRSGLGDDFLVCVADAFIRLEESPEQFPFYYRDFRRIMTERFPYKIFFRIAGEDVIVFRILHAARDHTRQLK